MKHLPDKHQPLIRHVPSKLEKIKHQPSKLLPNRLSSMTWLKENVNFTLPFDQFI